MFILQFRGIIFKNAKKERENKYVTKSDKAKQNQL